MSPPPRLLAALLLLPGASAARAETAPFAGGTARTLPAGRLETGVFGALRYGLTDDLTLSGHPLLLPVAPNAELQWAWGRAGALRLASAHGLLYPTPLMNLLARPGTGGVVPADVRYPQILASSHHLFASLPLGSHLLSARAGGWLSWALTSFDGPRFWSQVEWHLAWPRMASWFTGRSYDLGLSGEGPVWRSTRYRLELDRFFMPGFRDAWAWEWAALLEWRRSERFRVRAGAMWSWARFPYGTRLSPPLPLIDLQWGWDLPR